MFGTHKNYFLIFLVIQCSSTKTYINTVYLLGGNHWCISLRLGLGATLTDGDCTSSQTQGERKKKKKKGKEKRRHKPKTHYSMREERREKRFSFKREKNNT